jgi:hypothetical protein
MSAAIDYTNHSKDELFDVLEHIDEEQHPENALAAYAVLQDKFGVSEEDIENRYQNDGLLLSVLRLLFFPIAGELGASRNEIEEKLKKVSQLTSKIEA